MKPGNGSHVGDHGTTGRYRFDGIEVDAAAHVVTRDGQPQALEPKAFAVLLALLARPGELLGREELLDQVWGHRHVTPGVLTRAIAQLRAALDDDPQRPRYIQTQHALGYRFIGILAADEPAQAPPAHGVEVAETAPEPVPVNDGGPVSVASKPAATSPDHLPDAVSEPGHAPVAPHAWRRAWLAGLGAALVLALVAWLGRDRAPVAVDPSIAVLPFTTLSDAREDRYFADGLSAEMLNALAGIPGLKVAAWRPPEAIDRTRDIREQGRLLGVATLLDASVRREGQRLRVSARLSDTRSGYTLWSRNYDVDADAIFDTQADIAESVAQVLVDMVPEERASLRKRLAPTHNTMAFDAYLLGVGQLLRSRDEEARQEATGQFRKALDADAGFARAQAALCRMALWDFEFQRNTDALEAARLACLRARNMDPALGEVNLALGDLYRLQGDPEQALRHLDLAAADPAQRWKALAGRAKVHIESGQEEQAMRDFRQALQASPGNAGVHAELGYQQYRLGRYREAVDSYRTVVALRPDLAEYWRIYGALLQAAGEDEPAEAALRRSLEIETNENALSNLGNALYHKGDYAGAADLYRRAIELNPHNFRYLGNLGDALDADPGTAAHATESYAQATVLAQRYVDANPGSALALAALGWYRAQLGERDAALQSLRQAEALGLEAGEVALFKAKALAALGQRDQAQAALQVAREAGVPESRIASQAVFQRMGLAAPPGQDAPAPELSPAPATQHRGE